MCSGCRSFEGANGRAPCVTSRGDFRLPKLGIGRPRVAAGAQCGEIVRVVGQRRVRPHRLPVMHFETPGRAAFGAAMPVPREHEPPQRRPPLPPRDVSRKPAHQSDHREPRPLMGISERHSRTSPADASLRSERETDAYATASRSRPRASITSPVVGRCPIAPPRAPSAPRPSSAARISCRRASARLTTFPLETVVTITPPAGGRVRGRRRCPASAACPSGRHSVRRSSPGRSA